MPVDRSTSRTFLRSRSRRPRSGRPWKPPSRSTVASATWSVTPDTRPSAADEGGWGPPLASDREAVEWVAGAIAEEGIQAGIALDVAASHFFDLDSGTYRMASVGVLTSAQLVSLLAGWARDHHIVSIEDGLAEDDWAGWAVLTSELGSVQLVGDDLFVTNRERLETGAAMGVANAVLVKPNQVGTLSESFDVVAAARRHGYGVVVSARSGETEDSFLADLAVGTGAGRDQGRVGDALVASGQVEPAPAYRGGVGARHLCRRGRPHLQRPSIGSTSSREPSSQGWLRAQLPDARW